MFRMMSLLAAAMVITGHAAVAIHRPTGFLSRDSSSSVEHPSAQDTSEKWGKMDDFLSAIFSIACSWKHGEDIDSEVHSMIDDGHIKADKDEIEKAKKDIQKENMLGLARACGSTVAVGKGKCRQGCSRRWGKAMHNRTACDGKCVKSYDNFEKDCKSKVGNLENVYELEMKATEARRHCFEGHCAEFPTIWTKSESQREGALSSVCSNRCTDEQIAARCENRWILQVDFKRSAVRAKCSGENEIRTCFDKKKAEHSTAYDTCVSDGNGACDTQHQDCKEKSGEQGDGFCKSRKSECTEQVSKNCLGEHKNSLETAQEKCEHDAALSLDACESDALTKKRDEEIAKCKAELAPKCDSDCHKACGLSKMGQCLKRLESNHDPSQEFCEDLWRLFRDSSDVDPITGDPIVLLSHGRAQTLATWVRP